MKSIDNRYCRSLRAPAHLVSQLSVMTELNKQGRYDRMTDDLLSLTGETPTSIRGSSRFTRPSSYGQRPAE